MKINCNIADDLLPLYLDDACSADSRAALDEHLETCRACREKLTRMKNNDIFPQPHPVEDEVDVTDYAKKVKRHRIRLGICSVLLIILSVCVLTLCILTVRDMQIQRNPTIFEVEDGVYDLTANELTTTSDQVGDYLLYTNNTRIRVESQTYVGEVLLWSATEGENPDVIGYGKIEEKTGECTFKNLTAARRYRITCDAEPIQTVTVTDGRNISFWSSFRNVLQEIAAIIMD